MNWTELAPFLVILGGLGTMWRRLNSRIDTLDAKIGQIDAKFDALNRDIGELSGASHTHTSG